MTNEVWFSVKDVAHLFQVTDRTVRNWLGKSLLVGSKLCGRVRIDPADVRRFAKENQLRPDQIGRRRVPGDRTGAAKVRRVSKGKKKNG